MGSLGLLGFLSELSEFFGVTLWVGLGFLGPLLFLSKLSLGVCVLLVILGLSLGRAGASRAPGVEPLTGGTSGFLSSPGCLGPLGSLGSLCGPGQAGVSILLTNSDSSRTVKCEGI